MKKSIPGFLTLVYLLVGLSLQSCSESGDIVPVKELTERLLGRRAHDFRFELLKNKEGKDIFEISSDDQMTLDLTSYSKGVYLMVLKGGRNNVTKKLIIQ